MELLSAGVLIPEMVNLRNIAPGGYTLICLPVGGLQPFRLKTPRPFATGHVSWPQSSVGVLFLVLGRFLAVSLLLLAHAWWFFACICIYLHLFAFICIYFSFISFFLLLFPC